VAQLNSFVKGAVEQLGIEKPFARKLQLAVEEAVVNVIDYAYPAGKVGNIDVKVTSNGHQLRFIITDEGIAFNPTEASQVDTTLSAEERPVGGLGILLVRELMDSVNYERVDGKNILTLCKEMENKKVIN
jgi:sigma-B regulation protein RsbU (phosphoserine phosphatase)